MSESIFDLIDRQAWPEIQRLIGRSPEAVQTLHPDNQSFPLHEVCKYNPPLEVIVPLLCTYPQAISTQDNEKRIPMHHALENSASEVIVKFLLKEYPDSPYVVDGKGRFPLHLACKRGEAPKFMSKLLILCPEAFQTKDSDGMTPLDYAKNLKDPYRTEALRSLEMAPILLHCASATKARMQFQTKKVSGTEGEMLEQIQNQHREELAQQVAIRQKQRTELEKKVEEASKRADDAEETVDKLQCQLKDIREKYEESCEIEQEQRFELDELHREMESMAISNKQLKRASEKYYQHTQTALASRFEEIERTRMENEDNHEILRHQRQEIIYLESKLDEAYASCADFQEEAEALKERGAMLEAEVDHKVELIKKTVELEEKCSALRQKLNTSETEKDQLENSLCNANEAVKTLKADVAEKADSNTKLLEKTHELEVSRAEVCKELQKTLTVQTGLRQEIVQAQHMHLESGNEVNLQKKRFEEIVGWAKSFSGDIDNWTEKEPVLLHTRKTVPSQELITEHEFKPEQLHSSSSTDDETASAGTSSTHQHSFDGDEQEIQKIVLSVMNKELQVGNNSDDSLQK